MIQIAHRGNLDGPVTSLENDPSYIDRALSEGFDVEVDLWYVPAGFFLGHDLGNYPVTLEWLKERSSNLWIHCKNLPALEKLSPPKNTASDLNFFWHQTDDHTLTSRGFIWTFPNKPVCSKSVIVNLDKDFGSHSLQECYAICSDYPRTMTQ